MRKSQKKMNCGRTGLRPLLKIRRSLSTYRFSSSRTKSYSLTSDCFGVRAYILVKRYWLLRSMLNSSCECVDPTPEAQILPHTLDIAPGCSKYRIFSIRWARLYLSFTCKSCLVGLQQRCIEIKCSPGDPLPPTGGAQQLSLLKGY